MTDEDFDAFVERLVALAELLERDLTLSPAKQVLYFEALRDLELGAVIAGMTAAARSCKFFPKPVELRTLIVGDDEERAERAWQTWKQMALQLGAYRSPTFDDAALADTVVAVFGSWEQACQYDESPEMWVAKRKEFDRVYRVFRQRGAPNSPKRLAGVLERENVSKGYATDEQGQPLFDEHGQPRRLVEQERAALPAFERFTPPALPTPTKSEVA